MVEKAGPAQAEETALDPKEQRQSVTILTEDERWHILHQLLKGMANDLAEIKEELKLR
jgi:hypothetical protein